MNRPPAGFALGPSCPPSMLLPRPSCDACHLREDAAPLPSLPGEDRGVAEKIVGLASVECHLDAVTTRHDRRIAVHTHLDFLRIDGLEIEATVLEFPRLRILGLDLAGGADDDPVV